MAITKLHTHCDYPVRADGSTDFSEAPKKYPFPVWITTCIGLVLEVYKKDYRAMSDVYTYGTFALVWSEKTQRADEVLVNANFECDSGYGHAEVDATPEVLSSYDEARARAAAERCRHDELVRQANEETRVHEPSIGMTMVVAKGRKVPKGTKGIVAALWGGGGRVLLKPLGTSPAGLKDRSVAGQWIDARNLLPMERFVNDGEGRCANCGQKRDSHQPVNLECAVKSSS